MVDRMIRQEEKLDHLDSTVEYGFNRFAGLSIELLGLSIR